MKITNSPDFNGGIRILCGVVNILTQIDRVGRDKRAFYEKIFSFHSPIPHMIELLGKEIEYLDSRLPEVVRIQKIWRQFDRQLDPAAAASIVKELKTWVEGYEEGPELPPSFTTLFRTTGLVITEALGPPNAVHPTEYLALKILYTEFLSKLDIEGPAPFKKKVKEDLLQLIAYKTSFELVSAILRKLKSSEQKILIRYGQENCFYPSENTIILSHRESQCEYSWETWIQSLSSPNKLGFAHELIHVFHHLDSGVNQTRFQPGSCAEKTYKDPEEFTTIFRGDFSENSIGYDFGMPSRCNHIESYDFRFSSIATTIQWKREDWVENVLKTISTKYLLFSFSSILFQLSAKKELPDSRYIKLIKHLQYMIKTKSEIPKNAPQNPLVARCTTTHVGMALMPNAQLKASFLLSTQIIKELYKRGGKEILSQLSFPSKKPLTASSSSPFQRLKIL